MHLNPGDGDALVYLYRKSGFTLGGRDAYFYVNDKKIVNLSNNGYTWFSIREGEYSLKQRWPIDVAFKELELPGRWEAGRKYYYRLDTSSSAPTAEERAINPNMMIKLGWRLSRMDEAEALQEIAQCKLQPALEIT